MKNKIISGLCAGAMLIGMIEAPIIDIKNPMELVANAASSNTVSLSGYVWEDLAYGKDIQTSDDIYGFIGDNNRPDQGIYDKDVQLINDVTKATYHTHTDSNGYYKFDNVSVSDLPYCSIKMEYNGLDYTTVNSNKNISLDDSNAFSKAEEDSSKRNSLNKMGQNITSGKKADSTYSISASINGDYISDYYNYLSNNGRTNVSDIGFLNIGLCRRTAPNLALSCETYSAEIVDDGEKYTFYYENLNTPNSAVDNNLPYGIAFQRKYSLTEDLKSPVYTREVSTISDKSLSEAYITYIIYLTNNSDLSVSVNSINVFYPNDIELVEVHSKTADGRDEILNYNLESITNTSSNSALKNYICKRIILTNPAQLASRIKRDGKTTKCIYIKYRCKDSLAKLINCDVNIHAYSEISSYSVFSDDSFTVPCLGYDYDSSPNNYNNGIIENDNSGAPRFKLLLRTELHGDSNTHTYTSSIKKQPTCTEPGIIKYKCKCGYSYTEDVAKLGHSYTTKVIAPTSTEKGYTLHTCTRCAYSYKDNYVDALGIDISKCTITLGTSTYTYDGTAKKPSVTVKNGTTALTNGTDYTVSYSSNTNAGTGKVTITGKGSYTGTASKTFTINAKSVSGMTVTLSQTSYTYDGTAKKPTVTVKDGTKTLTSGTDYTVSYSNNVNVGTATVTVTGKGNYTGSKTANFTITEKPKTDVSKCTVTLGTTSYTYDGTAKKPSVTVKNGTTALTNGTDYTVSYSSNTNAGIGKATITGKGNYTGTASKTFTINAKSISGMTLTLSQSSYTYDGTAKKPTVTVKDGTKTLVNGTDYSVAYSNNVNVGTAKATVTGKGNYTGSVSKTFTIKAKPVEKKKFIEGGDNWCFSNSESNFGSTYYMSDKYWNALLKGLSNTEKANMKKYVNKAEWGGSCYGMATTSILASNGILKPGTYQKGASFLHDISKPPSKEVKSLINYYFALQYTDVIQQQICNNFYSDDEKAKLQSLLKCLEDGSPTLLCFHGYFYGFSWSGHAVVAYDVEYGSYSYNKKAYNGKILIYDNNSVNYNDDYCLYFNSSNGSWTIPHYGLDSSYGSILGLITDDLKYINYHGYLNGSSNVKVNDYIAVLHSAALSGNYKLTKAALSNGIWTATSASDDDIKVFSSFADTDFSKSDLMFAMKDASSGYIMKTSNTEKLDLTLSYENSLLVAEANKGKQAKFSPEGCIEVNGEKTDYTLGMTFNSDYPTEWYSIQVSGSNANNASMKKVNNGWVVSSDCLDCVIVNASNDDVEAKTIFSTKYPSALVYEINKNTIGVKVDTDNNGTYETEIKTGNNNISKATVTGISAKTYTGKAITQSPVVKLGTTTLKSGTDYTVAYKNNTKVGTATVTITGKGSYTGTISKTFKINAASIAKATVSGLSNKTYTGKAITQNPTVKLGSKTLKKGTDYTVSYKNNKAVGKATVTIKGKGNYTGSISKTFKINPKKTTLKTATSPKTKQLKVTYSKVSGVTGYQTVYSTSSKFTKATTKTASSKNTSKTISGLTKGKTYYVKVRTYKTVKGTKYYSGYSAVKKIKIK